MIERVYFASQTQVGDKLHSFWHDPGKIDYHGNNGVMLTVEHVDERQRKIFVPFTNVKSIEHSPEKQAKKTK